MWDPLAPNPFDEHVNLTAAVLPGPKSVTSALRAIALEISILMKVCGLEQESITQRIPFRVGGQFRGFIVHGGIIFRVPEIHSSGPFVSLANPPLLLETNSHDLFTGKSPQIRNNNSIDPSPRNPSQNVQNKCLPLCAPDMKAPEWNQVWPGGGYRQIMMFFFKIRLWS